MSGFLHPPYDQGESRTDFSRYRGAVFHLAAYLLGVRNKPLSCAGARHRIEKMPHSFVSVGDGVHIIPVTTDGRLVGYARPTSKYDIYQRKDLWIPESGIDREYLLPGGPFFDGKLAEEMLPFGRLLPGDVLPGDVLFNALSQELFYRSPEGRRELAIRSYRVFQRLGFPNPKMPRATWARIGTRLYEEKEARRNLRGLPNE